jgi:hypothetical protein
MKFTCDKTCTVKDQHPHGMPCNMTVSAHSSLILRIQLIWVLYVVFLLTAGSVTISDPEITHGYGVERTLH